MKNAKTVTVRNIKIQLNSSKATGPDWARILDADTGEILNTGRLPYIKRVAKKRYNRTIKV